MPKKEPLRSASIWADPLLRFVVKRLLLVVILSSGCLLWSSLAESCTLWAAAGKSVIGGGTLLAKNRDWEPKDAQVLKLMEPEKGYRYFVLLRDDHRKGSVTAGVNEEGLVVVSASPPYSREKRRHMARTPGLNRKLLANCTSVEQALEREKLFLGPRFLMLADRREIACVEIGPEGKVAIKRKKNGVLHHTNHYIDESLEPYNPRVVDESSMARLRRIGHFISSKPEFSLGDFLLISTSKEGGPNNSIWRDGTSPTSRKTMASWIIQSLPGGDFRLHVTTVNPGSEPTRRIYSKEDIFERGAHSP